VRDSTKMSVKHIHCGNVNWTQVVQDRRFDIRFGPC
jgi:hypothetical protein